VTKIEPRLKIEIKEPSACSESELRAFEELLHKGGAGSTTGLGARIRRARILSFADRDGQLAGIAAIKAPPPGYGEKVFTSAGVGAEAPNFNLELGWVLTDAAFRGQGIASALCTGLLTRLGPAGVFATTLSHNAGMLAILAKSGFRPVGNTFTSAEHPGELIRLLVRSSE
jgi:RimJ/RimL family protein N-acetyltransferase